MKVLLANNLYGADARGGAERVMETEARLLNAAGHEVTVVSASTATGAAGQSSRGLTHGRSSDARYADLLERMAADPVRHITYVAPNICSYSELGKHGYSFRLAWHLFDALNFLSARRFERILERVRPDVVHTHNLMGLGFMIPAMLRARGIRHVHTVHDVQLLEPSGLLPAERAFRPAPHQMIYISLMRRLMGSPAAVIFPSEFHMRLHERFGFFPRSRKAVVRNPAVGVSTAAGDRIMKDGNIFLFVGQVERHKGIFDLLDAWEAAKKTGSDFDTAYLEIAGRGAADTEVAERAAALPNVRLLGRLDGAALAAAYDRAAWLVLPSRVLENAPASVAEAAAHGTAVLASASGGIPEMVRHGESGLLFPPGVVSALTATLLKAASLGAAERDTYASRLRTLAMKAAPENHLAALLEAYE